jgi:hypothetical protein
MTVLLYFLTGWFLLSIAAGLFIGQLIGCRHMPGGRNHPDVPADSHRPAPPRRAV